jgi:hypothetical protein
MDVSELLLTGVIPGRPLKYFNVTLIGLFDQPLHVGCVRAKDRLHAIRIGGAVYDNCFKRGEAVEVGR